MSTENEPLQRYENTLYFSLANKSKEDGNVPADFLIEGDLNRLAAGIGCHMLRNPEIAIIFEAALRCYDGLLADQINEHN